MARIFIGVAVLAFAFISAGCGSSQPIRFQFKMPSGTATIEIDEGSVHRGNTDKVFTLSSNDREKTIKLTYEGRTIYGKMDTYGNTQLTRITIVPIHITADIFAAVDDFKAVTYIVYQRRRDVARTGRTASAGEDSQLRVYDYGDTVTRDAAIDQASLQGDIIAVIDFGNIEYLR